MKQLRSPESSLKILDMVNDIWVLTWKMDTMEGQHLQLLFVTKKSRGVPLSYAIRKYKPCPDDRENMDVQIIHEASFIGNMFIRDSRKVLDILK